jgi:hypothetical protein
MDTSTKIACLLWLALGCAPGAPALIPSGLRSPYSGYSSATYRADSMWLCRPDLPGDACHQDLTATEIHPDGSRTVQKHQSVAEPKVDCFYVYPTVDMRWIARNHESFDDLEPMRRTALAQAARFSEVCAVYAPLYRQVSIGTYLSGRDRRERFLEVAFSDVHDAFLHYLGQYNHGRKVALIGHSQGGDMVVRLLRELFDEDPALRQRLLVAMPIGTQLEVPRGRRTGATLRNVATCQSDQELGCLVAFRTHRENAKLDSAPFEAAPANEQVCVNPADLAGNERKTLSRTYLPSTPDAKKRLRGIDDVQTPFVLYRDYYAARCQDGPQGYRYLGVAPAREPQEKRVDPIDLENAFLNGGLGTHILDMQFTQGDLIDLVAKKAQAASP